MKKFLQRFTSKSNQSNNILLIFLVVITLIVYMTGGLGSDFINLFYIIIIVFSVNNRLINTIKISLVLGLLLLPLLLINQNSETNPSFLTWLLYFVLFLVIGTISGSYFDFKNKESKKLQDKYKNNSDTSIPNINAIANIDNNSLVSDCLVFKVKIANSDHIQQFLGTTVYYEILTNTYLNLKKQLPKNTLIYKVNESELVVIIKEDKLVNYEDVIKGLLSNVIEIDGIAIYIDYEIFHDKSKKISDCQNLLALKNYKNGKRKRRQEIKTVFNNNSEIAFDAHRVIELFPKAIKENELTLVFQPVITNRTYKIKGFESLVRWNSKIYGLIMPDQFIDIIEMTSLIQDLTDWVVKTAMVKQKEFCDNNLKVNISINISVKNLQDQNFFNRVNDILEEVKIDPRTIIFEITETKFLANTQVAIENLTKLRQLGFKIAIDDFGKGFSSFSYLSDFNIDIIKIDKFFIQNLKKYNDNFIIVKSLIELAHKLNLSIVAEGIETEEVYQIIKNLNCDYFQGFYFAKPIDDNKTLAYIQNYSIN